MFKLPVTMYQNLCQRGSKMDPSPRAPFLSYFVISICLFVVSCFLQPWKPPEAIRKLAREPGAGGFLYTFYEQTLRKPCANLSQSLAQGISGDGRDDRLSCHRKRNALGKALRKACERLTISYISSYIYI